jgi:hypothetical protein
MNSINTQHRLTFGSADFVSESKDCSLRQLLDYAGDSHWHCFAMKRGRSSWGVYCTAMVRSLPGDYPTG